MHVTHDFPLHCITWHMSGYVISMMRVLSTFYVIIWDMITPLSSQNRWNISIIEMVSSIHPSTSLCSPIFSAWLSVHWWHQNHRRTCCVSLFKTVSSLWECKTVLSGVSLLISPSQSRVCGSSVIFSLCRPSLDSGMTNTINLSPFTSGNSLLLTWHIYGSL